MTFFGTSVHLSISTKRVVVFVNIIIIIRIAYCITPTTSTTTCTCDVHMVSACTKKVHGRYIFIVTKLKYFSLLDVSKLVLV